MNGSRLFPPSPHRGALVLTAGWTMTGVALYWSAPRAAPVLLPMCMIAPLAWSWIATRRIAWQHPSAVIVALLLAATYLLINSSWSLSPAYAYSVVVLFLLVVLTVHV